MIEKAARNLDAIFREKNEVVIGIVDNELAWEGEILFDLSQRVHSFLLYLKDRGIERMTFKAPFSSAEFGRFVAALASPKIKEVDDPQEYWTQIGLQNIKAGKILVKAAATTPGVKKAEGLRDHQDRYEASVGAVSQSVESMLAEKAISSLDLGFGLLDLLDRFSGKNQKFLSFVAVKEKDVFTFAHLLNVSILAMHFASKMGYAKSDVLDVGQAALFHDIGKVYLSRKVLNKKEALTTEEYSMVRDHSILGARILLKYKEVLGVLPALAAFEHHIRYDLRGYPKLSFPCRPHLVSLMISVCDVYDALTQKRTYKKDYPPLQIYTLMTKEKGKLFVPELIDIFFRFMGVWPVGTIVVLNDERIAVVRESNEQEIFLPKVEVVFPENKRGSVDLAEHKGRLGIKEYLNPFQEGRRYLDFI